MTKKKCKKKLLRLRVRLKLEGKRKKAWREQSDIWKEKYLDCREDLEECSDPEPDPEPQPDPHDPAIVSLSTTDGKFIVNGKRTKLIGVSKRGMIGVGSGDLPQSEVNYTYGQIKNAILDSKINYIRVIAPLDLTYFRKEVKVFLKHGIVVEVELYDAGKSNRPWQAEWMDTFNAIKDLPVICGAHNEFMDYDRVATVNMIVNYVVNHGGLVSAGAWGASNHGEEYAKEFLAGNNNYQAKDHHQRWNRASIIADREPGKPLMWSEIHTRDNSLANAKSRLKLAVELCDAAQVYPLMNFGCGPDSKFQKILDYASSLV